ncbi:MAG: amylo-alpha-1,6-glucosidase [SAR324 cluster bacterium]|nr:amylo-alpha-1,6-glucosidase [SAR324 cluster bacterium]
MDEIIRVADQFYILASAALANTPTRVLKDGETFAIFDRSGDVQSLGFSQHGIFHEGTRFLSQMELYTGQGKPLLLSSLVKRDNSTLNVDLTNQDISQNGKVALPRNSYHLFRSKFLCNGVCYEQIRVKNYRSEKTKVILELRFDADFTDIFEVRGMKRARRGERLPSVVDEDSVTLGYRGLDAIERRTRILFSPRPCRLSDQVAAFELTLDGNQEETIFITLACIVDDQHPPQDVPFGVAYSRSQEVKKELESRLCEIHSSNEQFNEWVNTATADLLMVLTQTPDGLFPYAGIPWFSTIFGRDGIITALQCLWVLPEMARGVLRFLAARQARDVEPRRDAEPGKILHELRRGEMANLEEIPFGRYYGTIDASPLFVMLAGAYFESTGDLETIEEIWEAIELALEWIDTYGDRDGDGFVEYGRQSETGLVQQAWKDSDDSVFHADGRLAIGPIATCEVQGYVYAARMAASKMAEVRGLHPLAAKLHQQAKDLQEAFERTFWIEEIGTYALALDGGKQPCKVRTSNPGHCLFAGIVSEERARRVAESLLSADVYSGWGIRTVSAKERRYNPISYHNGSVWPHDTALIAQGFARYGLKEESLKVLTGLMDASLFMEMHRLPELFCGFRRRPGAGPILYPVACSPQAWSAGAVFMLLQACLGLSINQPTGRIVFDHPRLPSFIDWIRLKGLRIGTASVDLLLRREQDDVGIIIERREGDVEMVVIK